MLAVTSNKDDVAFRFRRSIANRRRYRPVCLKRLGINPVLAQVSPGNSHSLAHGFLITLEGREQTTSDNLERAPEMISLARR